MAEFKNKKRDVKSKSTGNKPNRISNFQNRNKTSQAPKEMVKKGGIFVYSTNLSVAELSTKLGITAVEIIKFLFLQGKMVNINTTLDDTLIELICLNFGFDVKKEIVVNEFNFEDLVIKDDPKSLIDRPAVVTIMGHVDHGKTTLLDAIRSSRVVEGEFGGITQHIGAYQVEIKGQKITFLDTPGHAAFSAMRARGSKITDIVIIVVAADDGVMPQTIEAIDHAKAARVPIIVAVNKIDKPGADAEKIKMRMTDLGLMPDEWGGSTIYVNVSAKMRTGIDNLLETILTVAELGELKANPKRYALGSVIEAKLDKGRGPVSTLLVQNGTLKVGDNIVVGASFGKIRQMRDDLGRIIKSAGPSKPVEVTGLNDVPEAGDSFMVFADEKEARAIGEHRKTEKVNLERRGSSALSLEDLNNRINEGKVSTINVIVKADVQGSAEAVKSSLEKMQTDTIKIDVIRSQAGAITESDVILASASNAIIYGFNVRPDAVVRNKAAEEKVDIRLHRVIYDIIDEVTAAMKGMLKPIITEVVTGQAEVRQLFKVSKVGTIAGCYVTTGSIKKDSKVRIIRQGVVVYEGNLGSLKRFQNDVKEATVGYECGIMVENYNDLKEQDIIEGYIMQETAAS